MARRLNVANGDYLPMLDVGIRDRAAHLASGMPTFRSVVLQRLEAGEPFRIAEVDVWSALYAVHPDLAGEFWARHGGPWRDRFAPTFTYDPRTCVLTRDADPDGGH